MNAVPLYFMRPSGINPESEETVMGQFGIDPSTAGRSSVIRRAVSSVARGGGRENWNTPKSDFGMSVYYDVTDVDGVTENDLDNYSNVQNTEPVDPGITPDENNPNGSVEQGLTNKISKYAEQNNVPEVKLALERGGLYEGLKAMVEQCKPIFRNRDATERRIKTEQVLLVLLKHYGIMQDVVNKLYKKYLSEIQTPNGVNQKLFISILNYANTVETELNGIKEAQTGQLTLDFVLSCFGLTYNDFQRMPKDEQQAAENVNNVKESFNRFFGRLVEAEENR